MRNPFLKLLARKLKFFLLFLRRRRDFFTGVGVMAVSAAFIVYFFMFIWWGIRVVRSVIEFRLERAVVERLLDLIDKNKGGKADEPDLLKMPVSKEPVRLSDDTADLIAVSFSDFFSGTGWLDTGATTMYLDYHATAFMFEPQLELKPISSMTFINSIGQIGLIGEVIKAGEVYKGLISRADGTPIFTEANTPIVSRYPGALAFGGDENDFLAVYGAYEGLAFRIRAETENCKLKIQNYCVFDISSLLGIRLMDGGFRPAVLRAKSLSAWYIWDAENTRFRFLKLFEDGAGNIIGAANLAEKFIARLSAGETGIGGEIRRMEFIPVYSTDPKEPYKILIRFIFADENAREFEFIDRGFFIPAVAVVQSSDLTGGRAAKVRRARITGAGLANVFYEPAPSLSDRPCNVFPAGSAFFPCSSASFYLANRPGEWLPVRVGEWLTFPDAEGKNLFWKAEFFVPAASAGSANQTYPSGGPSETHRAYTSPFFSFINVEYFIKL